MKNEIKIIIVMSVIMCIIITLFILGISYHFRTIGGNEAAIQRAETINKYNISVIEGQTTIIAELEGYRDREKNRLDREKEIARRERELTEREKQIDSRERERIDSSREIYSQLGSGESSVEETVEAIKETIRRGEEIIEEIMAGNN